MTRKEPELLTDIRDLTALYYVIMRRKSSEWLESSTQSGLDMRFAKWSLHLHVAILDFAFCKHLNGILLFFVIWEHGIFISLILYFFRS